MMSLHTCTYPGSYARGRASGEISDNSFSQNSYHTWGIAVVLNDTSTDAPQGISESRSTCDSLNI